MTMILKPEDRIQADLDRFQELQAQQDKYEFPLYIDSSMRAAFAACPQKFAYSHIEHLAAKHLSEHLHFGKVLAAGVETARRGYYDLGMVPEEALEEGRLKILEDWQEYQPKWSWQGSPNAKTLDGAIAAIEAYFSAWPLDTDYLIPYKEAGRSAIEFSFAFPLPVNHPETGEPILYVGRFDMLAMNRQMKALFGLDEKTTGGIGPTWPKQWSLRSQFTGYCCAARHYDFPVAGMVVRGIAVLKTQIKTVEAITYRPEWTINRWLRQLCQDIERMKEQWKSGDWDMSLDGACSHYGGCPFMPLCEAPNPKPWKKDYIKYKWNPLEDDQ